MLSKISTDIVLESFKDLALTSEHADIYIALLKNGPNPASIISKITKIPRSSCYDYLYELIEIGLVSSVRAETKKVFMPASPEQLKFLIQQKYLQSQHYFHSLENNLSELRTIFSSHQPNFPSVRFFEGESGLKTALHDSLSADEVFVICQGSSVQSGHENNPKYLRDYLREFKLRRIKSKKIIEDTPAGKEYKKKFGSEFVKVKLLPKRTVEKVGHVDKLIYGDKICYIAHDNLVGVIIQDETLAAHEKLLFEDLWEKAD
ncbi:hypothetical protein JW978_03390 [Candidatus Dojkabacteria bacterium]|nr:hypothetical protein [Candidatus Dojkabacteria bacterium]